jgi:2-polyprenyl-3-methyl-5-hydroxy-6-metoxy-1,4-benzoquinol methylase
VDLFLPPNSVCPICASARLESRSLEISYWREHLIRFDRCSECGAVFANPMPSDELISRGNSALVRWYQQGRTFEHEFRDARQAYLRGRVLARRLKRFKRKGRLLDLGCYNGFLLLGVRDHSEWEVEGLEISDDLSHFIEGKLGIRCHNGTLETLALPSASYDFVVCHDLIEHINRPEIFLSEIARILRPGGRIQIITPNAIQDLSFARRAWASGTPLTMLLNHILMFSPRALETALARAGLRIRRLYGYDVRYSLKDFGLFGLGKPVGITQGPLLEETIRLPLRDLLAQWEPARIAELRSHRKTSAFYGFVRETLPGWLTWRVPARLGIGHELYALAEKEA